MSAPLHRKAQHDLRLRVGPDEAWAELRKREPDFALVESAIRTMPKIRPASIIFSRAVAWIIRFERDRQIQMPPSQIVEARMLFAQIVAFGRMAAARAFVNLCDNLLGPAWRGEEIHALAGAPSFPVVSRLADEPERDIQICRAPSSTWFIVFCGRANRFGCALNIVDLYFQSIPVNVIYLRDSNGSLFLEGIRTVGDRNQTVTELSRILSQSNAARIVCLGNSGGGYGALAYADALSANQVVCLSGRSTLNRAKKEVENRPEFERIARMIADGLVTPPDLIAAYATSRIPVYWVFGELNPFDAYHAREFSGTGVTTLEPVSGWHHHNVVGVLARTGRLQTIFAAAAAGTLQ